MIDIHIAYIGEASSISGTERTCWWINPILATERGLAVGPSGVGSAIPSAAGVSTWTGGLKGKYFKQRLFWLLGWMKTIHFYKDYPPWI